MAESLEVGCFDPTPRLSPAYYFSSFLAQLGEARFLLGNWAEARARYERSVQMSRIYPAPHYAAFALLGLGALDLAEGRWEEATQLIET